MNTPAKILVVDDTPRNVKLLADLLAVKGYGVVTAASGSRGFGSGGSERPDLVLLDVVMPEMSGYEVCRKIREKSRDANAAGGDGDGARSWLKSESKGSKPARMIFSPSRSIKRSCLRE